MSPRLPAFLHCNFCSRLQGIETINFYLASCGHVACCKCLDIKLKPLCTLCKKLVNTMAIDMETMPFDVKACFVDAKSLLVEATKSTEIIVTFQDEQLKSYLRHYPCAQMPPRSMSFDNDELSRFSSK